MENQEKRITRKEVDAMSEEELKDLINKLLEKYDDESLILQLIEQDGIFRDIKKGSQGKRDRPYVKEVIGTKFENVFDDENNMILKTIRHIQLMILTDSFNPPEHIPMIINDNGSNKEREIIKPRFEDEQIIHHALMRILIPVFQKSMYMYSCASIPNKGMHMILKHVRKVISNDHKNTKYVLKMDVRKFFDSIPHRKLKQRLRYVIKDESIRKLLFKVIDTIDKGLPLGFYTSQWLANFYLTPLDHYIKERICDDIGCNTKRTKRHGAKYYFRYMDDMVIFGPNKRELHKMRIKIEEVLNEEYGLHLKSDWQVFRLDYIDIKDGKRKGRFLDFVGFRFYHDKVTIRKRTYKNILKLIKHLKKVGKNKISFHDAAAMLSYYGFIYWSDSKGLYEKLLKPYVTLKDLKNIIRKEYARRTKEVFVEEENS